MLPLKITEKVFRILRQILQFLLVCVDIEWHLITFLSKKHPETRPLDRQTTPSRMGCQAAPATQTQPYSLVRPFPILISVLGLPRSILTLLK